MRLKRPSNQELRAAAPWAAIALAAAAGLGVGALLFGKARRPPAGNPAVPEPHRPVDLALYLGRWYELARYDNRFERNCEGVTAEYALLADGEVSVRNSGQRNGRAKIAKGKARPVPGSANTKFKLSFFGPFYGGDYWILDHAEDYTWSIVGEPSGRYLWILVRDPHPDDALRQSLFRRAVALGYDISRLRITQQ